MGKKPLPNNKQALEALRASVSPHVPVVLPAEKPEVRSSRRIITVEFVQQMADGAWAWHEYDGGLKGVLHRDDLDGLGPVNECDTLRIQIETSATTFTVLQVVPASYKTLPDKQRRERVRELRRRRAPTIEKKITHLNASPPPGLRRVITATITAITDPKLTWHAVNGDETMTSESPLCAQLTVGQRVNVVLQESSGTLRFLEVVPHTTQPRAVPERSRLGELTLDAMYNLEPGDVVDAFIAFTGTPGTHDIGRDGKTRPAIFLAKRGTSVLLRGLTDGEGSYSQRLGNTPIRDWKEAGLTKPSVVLPEDQEVDIADVWVTRGRLSLHDRKILGIG